MNTTRCPLPIGEKRKFRAEIERDALRGARPDLCEGHRATAVPVAPETRTQV
jgi:hypothetical protein